jgi:predicted amidohydrolase
VAQLTSNDDIVFNFLEMKKLIIQAGNEKAELIVFPENSLFFRIDSESQIKSIQISDPLICDFESLASQYNLSIHLTTSVLDYNNKNFNASILIQPGLKAQLVYRKIHLFDIQLAGQKPIRESDVFSFSNEATTFELNGFVFANSICYDLRFSDLYSLYSKKNVDVILVPAAFLVKTGIAHWEVLLRARAIESQCYILAPAQVGRHESSLSEKQFRETYGHSMAVHPWGNVLNQLQQNSGLFFVEINHQEIENIRQQIPMQNHRREIKTK